MKKFLTAFLCVCACAFVGAGVGCKKSNDPDSSAAETRTVTFETGEGYTFRSNVSADGTIAEGSQLSFQVELGAFYTGTPIAYVNDQPVAANAEGIYNFVVGDEDLIIRIDASAVRKDISNMSGSGAMDDAFVVTKPIDLVYIAEQVNKGNTAYTKGAYVLANDIDCKGEEIKVIGDYSTPQAVFSGSFACESDPDTGATTRHTISNFRINSQNSNYVGLFGAVFADMTVQSSGLIYGICLDDFTIEAGTTDVSGENKTVSCGALVGYSVGANYYLCEATNGEINVNADSNYFSFVGGLVGYQQSFYDPSYEMYYASEISYAKVDVDVNILGGVSLYAGGIAGYMVTNYPFNANSSVHNSYSTGSVSGALRSGGIAGGLGQYCVVSNCYATGEITARSYQSYDSPLITSDEYSHAYAGGLVGYAENDSVTHDSFFNGNVSTHTVSTADYEHTDKAVGGGDPAKKVSASSDKYVVLDCIADVDLADEKVFTNRLGWQSYNWTFTAGELPVINHEAPETTIKSSLTLHYVAPNANATVKVGGKTQLTQSYFDTSIQSLNSYSSIGTFVASGGLAQYYESDDGEYLSYGYFFDEECTKRVPYAYFPMKDISLYVGFADPDPIVGVYHIFSEDTRALTLTLRKNGTAEYVDGSTALKTQYYYDGTELVLENARLARYFNGAVPEIDEEDTSVYNDGLFDLYRYDLYNFVGVKTGDCLSLFDGKYFTAADPLRMYSGEEAERKASFRGEWYAVDGSNVPVAYYVFYGDTAIVETATGKTTYAVTAVTETSVTLTKGETNLTVQKADLKPYDKFKGSWVKSATLHKSYTFDGIGKWTYEHVVYERSVSGYLLQCKKVVVDSDEGTYTSPDGGTTVVFTHDNVTYTASVNSDGFLEIENGGETQIFYADYSYVGIWKGGNYELTLHGIRENGYGEATLVTSDGFTTNLFYEVSETKGYIALFEVLKTVTPNNATPDPDDTITTVSRGMLYGYACYNVNYNMLEFVLPNQEAEAGYVADMLYLFDDYYGEWVCEDNALGKADGDKDVTLEFIFNGMGLYSDLGFGNVKGSLTIVETVDGKETKTTVAYTLDSSLQGSFPYGGKLYIVSYDELNRKIIVSLNADTELTRKDEFADKRLVDLDGNYCDLDGRSPLTTGGTLTFKDEDYTYLPATDGYDVKKNGALVGSMKKVEADGCYRLTIDGTSTDLYIVNKFMGKWAISNQYDLFEIGPTDTNGIIKAKYKGADVELTTVDPGTLTFKYVENKMPYTYYVYVIEDEATGENVLVLSEFTNLFAGEYFICSKVNDLFGTWEWSEDGGKTTMKFDGVTSGYVNGYAELTLTLNYSEVVTEYFYSMRENGIVFWSRAPMAGKTVYFRLDLVDKASVTSDKGYFELEGRTDGKVLVRTEVDGLFLTEAFDREGNKYLFDGNGNMKAMDENDVVGEVKYTYEIKSFNADNTATLHVVDVETNVKYEATLDYKDATHILFTVGERVVETVE